MRQRYSELGEVGESQRGWPKSLETGQQRGLSCRMCHLLFFKLLLFFYFWPHTKALAMLSLVANRAEPLTSCSMEFSCCQSSGCQACGSSTGLSSCSAQVQLSLDTESSHTRDQPSPALNWISNHWTTRGSPDCKQFAFYKMWIILTGQKLIVLKYDFFDWYSTPTMWASEHRGEALPISPSNCRHSWTQLL